VYVGYELNDEYIKLAKKRIADATQQLEIPNLESQTPNPRLRPDKEVGTTAGNLNLEP
jgi:hypothetical protein